MQRTTNNENYKRIEIGLLKSHEESLSDLLDTNKFVTYDINLGKGIKSGAVALDRGKPGVRKLATSSEVESGRFTGGGGYLGIKQVGNWQQYIYTKLNCLKRLTLS